MARLILALRDLYPTRLEPQAQAALPRLPELERWLQRGDADLRVGDWRRWLLQALSGGQYASATPAAIAGAAHSTVPEGAPLWFATPVHYVAGLDRLRLHPAGLLDLHADEQQQLAADFSAVFTGSGWSLHATGRRELLLSGGASGAVTTQDPALWLGADPAAGLPNGERSAPLRRLGAEIEMWLHEHAVNAGRRRRGLLVVNAFWLWGGGQPRLAVRAAAPAAPAGRGTQALAADLFVDGLMRLCGGEVSTPGSRLPSPLPDLPRPDRLVVCDLGAAPDAIALTALERDWIAPALAQWRDGAWETAVLLAGTRATTLARGSFRRLLRSMRRPRPWWETLLQC